MNITIKVDLYHHRVKTFSPLRNVELSSGRSRLGTRLLGGGGGGERIDLLALLAFLPSAISSVCFFLTPKERGGVGEA